MISPRQQTRYAPASEPDVVLDRGERIAQQHAEEAAADAHPRGGVTRNVTRT